MPLVSVIMPSYNHEGFISEAIESVLNQTFADLELIIIDDASKDKSKEIIKVYEERDSRIRTIFHNENEGIARTMNEGLEEAKGKFIAFTASDDVWVKDKLEKQIKVLEQNENLIVWAEAEIIDAHSNPTGELFTQRYHASERKKSGDIFEELLRGNFIGDRILKRGNLGDIRFNEALKYLNDYQFDVDLATKYEYYFIQEPLAKYRIHDRNTITSDKEGFDRDCIAIGQYFLRKYGTKLTNSMKAHIFGMVGTAYSNLGEKAKARWFIFQAIKHNPCSRANPIYLAIVLTKDNGFVRNILRWGHRRLTAIKGV